MARSTQESCVVSTRKAATLSLKLHWSPAGECMCSAAESLMVLTKQPEASKLFEKARDVGAGD